MGRRKNGFMSEKLRACEEEIRGWEDNHGIRRPSTRSIDKTDTNAKLKKSKHQDRLIHNDFSILIEKEACGNLTQADRVKFKLLAGRLPKEKEDKMRIIKQD